MRTSVESISTLERRLTVGVPAATIDEQVEQRLAEAARTTQVPGFRRGKVPLKLVRQRFGDGVRQDVLGRVVSESFQQAVTQEKLRPAGMPQIEPKTSTEGQDFEYIATFEVYPEIALADLSGLNVTRLQTEITDQDIDKMIANLRQQAATWDVVSRAAKTGDRVNIDFTGFRDGVEFPGGKGEGSDLVLGSGSMIPGFEDGIIGMQAGEEKQVALTFPEDYHAEDLKGAKVEFKIKVNTVNEQKLPEVNETFFLRYGVTEGGLDKFRTELRANMSRELTNALWRKLKTQVLEGLNQLHVIEVPKSLVTEEIGAVREQFMRQFGGGRTIDGSMFPDELFTDEARKRVSTGLILGEIIRQENIRVDGAKVRDKVREYASVYSDPEEVVRHYYDNRQLLASVESLVLEDQVIDTVLAKATVTDQNVSYEEAVKPEQAGA